MTSIYISSNNIISSLGFNTKENINKIKKGVSGIKFHENLMKPFNSKKQGYNLTPKE